MLILEVIKLKLFFYFADYRVGSTESWSPVLQFKTLPSGENWTPTLLIFGDLGNGNDRTVAMLQDEIQSERSDFAIHLGDFAYNLEVSSIYKTFSYF